MMPVTKRKSYDWATLGGRLEWLLFVHGMSGRAFAEWCGLSPATINTSIKRNRWGGDAPMRVAKKTGVNLTWLMTGVGQPGLSLVSTAAADTHVDVADEGGDEIAERTSSRTASARRLPIPKQDRAK